MPYGYLNLIAKCDKSAFVAWSDVIEESEYKLNRLMKLEENLRNCQSMIVFYIFCVHLFLLLIAVVTFIWETYGRLFTSLQACYLSVLLRLHYIKCFICLKKIPGTKEANDNVLNKNSSTISN